MEDLQKEIRRQNRITAGWLLLVDERHQEYAEKMMCLPRTDSGLVMIPGGKGVNSDKTAKAAIARTDTNDYYRRWLSLVVDVEIGLPQHKLLVLTLKRQSLSFRDMQYHYSRELQVHMGIRVPHKSRDWFKRTWKEIVEAAARMAAERGLFKNAKEDYCE